MREWIRVHLREEAEELGIDFSSLTFFKRIGGDLSSGGKALFEVMERDSSTPIWVVKAARSPLGSPALLGEFERLKALQRDLPREMRANVPAPICFHDHTSGAVMAETALSGQKSSQLLRMFAQPDPFATWKRVGELGLVWLQSYSQHAPRFDWTWDFDWWRTELCEPLTPLSDFLRGLSPSWETVDQAIQNQASKTTEKTFSNVLQHGDYTPTNIVIEGRRIGIFDWSPADSKLPPLLDLTHFLVSSSLYSGQSLERKTKLSDLTHPVCSDERFLEPVRLLVTDYAWKNKIDPEDVEALTLASLALKILAYARRPEPIVESLKGWIFAAAHWVENKAASRLVPPHSEGSLGDRS